MSAIAVAAQEDFLGDRGDVHAAPLQHVIGGQTVGAEQSV
jgi:hypothetical protein